MWATTSLASSKKTVFLDFNLLAEVNIEYLRINIEDTSDVPIKLSFPVAFNFMESAFNECSLLNRDRSKRSNALVDDLIQNETSMKN